MHNDTCLISRLEHHFKKKNLLYSYSQRNKVKFSFKNDFGLVFLGSVAKGLNSLNRSSLPQQESKSKYYLANNSVKKLKPINGFVQ